MCLAVRPETASELRTKDESNRNTGGITQSPLVVELGAALFKLGGALADLRRYDEALTVAKQIRGLDFKLRYIWHDEVCIHVIRRLLDDGTVDRALAIVAGMESAPHQDGALLLIARWARDNRRPNEYEHALGRVRSEDLRARLESE